MASYGLKCNLPGNRKNLENMVLAFDPQALFPPEEEADTADFRLEVSLMVFEGGLKAEGTGLGPEGAGATCLLFDEEIKDPRYRRRDFEVRKKEVLRRAVFQLLTRLGRDPVPWGILTGVRPTKIYHYLRDKGFSPSEVRKRLETVYALSPEKARLLAEVGETQRPFIIPNPKKVGVYVGIPFCPTRCDYCSFAAYPLATHGHLLKGFLEALSFEIREMGEACRNSGYRVDCLYLGGGTPTVLSHGQLAEILFCLVKNLPLEENCEFTVEAGRPETLDLRKLKILKELGVNRVSVNPQTMNDRTLELIGRRHSTKQVEEAVSLLRKVGIPCLNMDLIMGLPGEGIKDWENTLAKVESFAPENLTVHTLAPKRAAAWDFGKIREETGEETLAGWLEEAACRLRGAGYHPYYLYRQRRILAEQENTGYSRKGWEGLYNILMMEERRTILGMGGGAMTKWIDPETLKVERTPNPKCPATYKGRVKELVKEKVRLLLQNC